MKLAALLRVHTQNSETEAHKTKQPLSMEQHHTEPNKHVEQLAALARGRHKLAKAILPTVPSENHWTEIFMSCHTQSLE